MELVISALEIIEHVIEQARRPATDHELRQRQGRARQLQIGLLEVVRLKVAIATGPNEVANLQIDLLRHHVRQQGV